MSGTPAGPPLRGQGLRSSWETPFTVVSSLQLVDGIGAPGEEELDALMGEVMDYIEALEKEGAVMIADFEGEMVGHGGELVTAAFLPTHAVVSETLQQRSAPGKPATPGLLVDLRCRPGVKVVRKIMESARITKLVWGAETDLESLMHQDSPLSLGVQPQRLVDVQIAFSEPRRRLGMAKMLERVPASFVKGLPGKGQIAFDEIYSHHRRALPLPLSRTHAAYAMDDLHRIEAILQSQRPPGGSYTNALHLTDDTVRATRKDPLGTSSLRGKIARYRTRGEVILEGRAPKEQMKVLRVRQQSGAVRIKRHILSSRAKGAQAQQDGFLSGSFLARAEKEVDAFLRAKGVKVPADLSFSEAS